VLLGHLEGVPHQGLLAGEVVGQQAGGGAQLGGDGSHGEAVEALGGEHAPHRLRHLAAARVAESVLTSGKL
jgi:hypothetical protein